MRNRYSSKSMGTQFLDTSSLMQVMASTPRRERSTLLPSLCRPPPFDEGGIVPASRCPLEDEEVEEMKEQEDISQHTLTAPLWVHPTGRQRCTLLSSFTNWRGGFDSRVCLKGSKDSINNETNAILESVSMQYEWQEPDALESLQGPDVFHSSCNVRTHVWHHDDFLFVMKQSLTGKSDWKDLFNYGCVAIFD